MIHPDTELRFVSERIGYGVVATRLIPKGTITWARDLLDRTLSPREVATMDPFYQPIIDKYAFVDLRGDYVLCWDLARFLNHSCEATCLAPGYEFEVAVRDIRPGEQLTDDYGALNIEELLACECGSPACRREIRPDDFERYADGWDSLLRDAFPRLDQVAQPLWPLVREKEAVARAIADPRQMASSRLNQSPLAEEVGEPGSVLRSRRARGR